MCVKKETLIILLVLHIFCFGIAFAASPQKSEDERSVELEVQMGYGRESNVFLSENNAKSDRFLELESILSHLY